jgi:hypothetical protein
VKNFRRRWYVVPTAVAALLAVAVPAQAATPWTQTVLPAPIAEATDLAAAPALSCQSTTSCEAIVNSAITVRSTPLFEAWNGASWSAQTLATPSGVLLPSDTSLSCVSSVHCVVLGSGVNEQSGKEPLFVDTLSNGSWTTTVLPMDTSDFDVAPGAVSCVDATHCVVTGASTNSNGTTSSLVVYTLSGATWVESTVAGPSSVTDPLLTQLQCFAGAQCVATGYGFDQATQWPIPIVARGNGTSWSVTELSNADDFGLSSLSSLSCSSATSCLAVGSLQDFEGHPHPLTATLVNNTWTLTMLGNPTGTEDGQLQSLSCGAAGSCEAVGWSTVTHSGSSDLLTETLTQGQWSAAATSPVFPSAAGAFVDAAIGCVTSECLVLGSFTPAGAGDLLGGPASMFAGVDVAGSLSSVAAPTLPSIPDSYLRSVSCASATTCVSVGYGNPFENSVATIVENENDGQWTSTVLPSPPGLAADLTSVSCASTSSCVAVGSAVGVSTGTLEPFTDIDTNGVWSVGPVVPTKEFGFLDSVSCVSVTHCVAVGGDGTGVIAATWNGATWSTALVAATSGVGLEAQTDVSCVSATFCESFSDSSANGKTFADELSGSTWTKQAIPAVPPKTDLGLGDMSCASTGHCVTVGSDGPNAVVYRLTGSSWKLTVVPALANSAEDEFIGVSCASTSRCAIDGVYINGSGDAYPLVASLTPTTVTTTALPATSLANSTPFSGLVGISCVPTHCVGIGIVVGQVDGNEAVEPLVATN